MPYSTNDEKEFLNGLGTFYTGRVLRDPEEDPKHRRIRLLKNYVEACENRKIWNQISSHEAIAWAVKLIILEEVKCK